MDEQITKAQQTAAMLRKDVYYALSAAREQRPEGANRTDRIVVTYLMECLDMAAKLESKLEAIGD